MELERQAHMADLERKQKAEERRLKYSMPGVDEHLTRKEREQRIWAFMNYRPTDSDLEYDEEDDEEDLTWLEYELEEQLRNPNVTDPDVPDNFTPEELSQLIRIDDNRIDYGPAHMNG